MEISTPYHSLKKLSTKKLVFISLMSGLMCILAPVSIHIPLTPVPVSLGLFAVFICSYILEPISAFLCILIYIILGCIGLPVFSGFIGGLNKIAGPTGGFIFGFLFTAFISSFFIHRFKDNYFIHFLAMFFSLIPCYILGAFWFSLQQNVSFENAVKVCIAPFFIMDFLKILAAVFLGNIFINRLKKAGITV